jgi:FixJ family two-component response regulator
MLYIIDDDKSVRRSFEILFAAAGLDCKSFSGAQEFLDSYEQTEQDFLVLDIHMPGINGNQLLNILKERKINIPVVTITAYDEEEGRQYAKDYGVIEYFKKPVDGDAIINLILKNSKR